LIGKPSAHKYYYIFSSSFVWENYSLTLQMQMENGVESD
jgi:predicted alpha/beta superfamily hydrolase